MVQDGAVLLNVEAELVGETLAGRLSLERAQSGRQRLPEGKGQTLPTSHEHTLAQTRRLYFRTLTNATAALPLIKKKEESLI